MEKRDSLVDKRRKKDGEEKGGERSEAMRGEGGGGFARESEGRGKQSQATWNEEREREGGKETAKKVAGSA